MEKGTLQQRIYYLDKRLHFPTFMESNMKHCLHLSGWFLLARN